jgi:glycosyltransferase involved in cell wall biosynthesis
MEKGTIAVIIPTHNRKDSLEQLLLTLGGQTYPTNLVEVIVVADGCTDSTLQMLKNFSSAYTLKFVEQPSAGPAVARNKGAALADSKFFLFLDDDIIPSPELLEAHVQAHTEDNMVVIGYLPLIASNKRDFFFIQSRLWWEEKYYKMQEPGYRFSYQDLLSGNFSVPAELFHLISGFDSTLRCREDYELGARLIQHGARFAFTRKAWGYHNDTSNSFERARNRKRQEGEADVKLGLLHPYLIPRLPLSSFATMNRTKKKTFVVLIFRLHTINTLLFQLLGKLLTVLEILKLRSPFLKLNAILNQFWYFKGVAGEIKSSAALHSLVSLASDNSAAKDYYLEVDIANGLHIAEQQIDDQRPAALHVKMGPYSVGKINYNPEAEHLRGVHLRPILGNSHSLPLMKVLALNLLTKNINYINKYISIEQDEGN